MADQRVFDRISDYPFAWAEQDAAREALVLAGERTTYGELVEEVTAWAKWLVDAGVQLGDRVAVVSNPNPFAIALFLATSRVGGIFLGLSPKHQLQELAFQVADGRPRVLIDAFGLPEFDDLAEAAPGCARVVRAPFDRVLRDSGGVTDSTLTGVVAAVDAADPAALVYTSGSTGRPKGALLAHRGFTWPSHVQAEHWFDDTPGSMINNLPIDHVGSLGNITASALVSGGTVVFQERFDAVEFLDIVERERIAYWLAVPAMFTLSVKSPRWPTTDLSSIRRFIWSGGAAPLPLIKALRSRCPRLSNSYGLTETVGEVTFSDPDDDDETLATTIGRPEPRYEVRLAREDGSDCEPGESGEIVVRGDFIMRGYLNAPGATAEAIDSDGWLHTGDVAARRDDGCFTLVGRKKEMFKSGGYNVYPREVELVLEEHPAVQLAAVIAVPDDVYGEVGNAFVLAAGAEVDSAELGAFVRARLANYKVPKVCVITEDLPMTGVGKIDKQALASSLPRRGTEPLGLQTGHD